jgi:hypothetical protein
VSVSPEAVFDCLSICRELGGIAGGAGESEIANFGYLGCLLSVYRGLPPSDWGYSFAATKAAAPYSEELSEALESCRLSGLVDEGGNGFSLSIRGSVELEGLSQLRRFSSRRAYIDAACQSATAIPLPLVTESLSAEPQLRQALRLSSLRPLLDEAGRHVVLSHFAALSQAVAQSEDLFVPAVVWLAYLARQVEADAVTLNPSDGSRREPRKSFER